MEMGEGVGVAGMKVGKYAQKHVISVYVWTTKNIRMHQ